MARGDRKVWLLLLVLGGCADDVIALQAVRPMSDAGPRDAIADDDGPPADSDGGAVPFDDGGVPDSGEPDGG
jgi:hypothetical protein